MITSKIEITTKKYISEWQQALQTEINHLKKYGSNRFIVRNGRLLSSQETFQYYFDTFSHVRIPLGSTIKLEWGGMKSSGRMLSSEGKGVILSLEKNFGDMITEASLLHDPWELLEQLIQRFEEIKKSKKKRLMIKKLMNPTMEAMHPTEKIKSNVHELILRSKYNPVTFVWGPPGTGKTHTLARVAANKYLQKKRVLILAHSNQAVDVLLSEIASFLKKKEVFQIGDVLRYGGQTGDALTEHLGITTNQLIKEQDPKLAEDREKLIVERRSLKQDLAHSFSVRDSQALLEIETKIARILEKVRQREVQLLKEANIIGMTLAKAASDNAVFEKEYDVVILDEASMAYVPQIAFAATLAKRVIICGDFKQLPPIAASRDPLVTKWLKEDVYHKAGVVDSLNEKKLHPHLFLLKEQRRMHPDISAFTNQYIYHSLVGNHESVTKNRNHIVKQAPFPDSASVLVDTSYTGMHGLSDRATNSRINLWQLLLSFQLIHESYLGGAKSIGYVTPYRAQANLMEFLLSDIYEKECSDADIIAATVHRFQGSERDVMIFDTVDGPPQNRAGMLLTGKDSERLINVAITRTKGKFLHVGNYEFIKRNVYQSKTLRQLVEHQVRNKQRVTTKQIGTWILNQHEKLQWMHARKLDAVFRDMELARASIIISLPVGTVLPQDWKEKLIGKSSHICLTVVSGEDWSVLCPTDWIKESFPFPFVMMDDCVLWLGQPLEGAQNVEPPYVAARLVSRKICEQILSQL